MHTTPMGPAWDGVIASRAVPGLSTCLEEGRLTYGTSSVPSCSLDLETLRVIEDATAHGRPVVLCPADPLLALAALIPAAVHIASMTAARLERRVYQGSALRVAVVTSDYRMRSLYRSLGVRPRPTATSVPMRDVVPAATVGPDGSLHVTANGAGTYWSTAFTRSVAEAQALPNVDLLVVDLPAPDAEAVLQAGVVPAVVVARDPSDPMVDQLARTLPVFVWDMADLPGRTDLTPRLAARATGEGCVVAGVVDSAVCENAGLFWQDIGPLAQLARRSVVGRQLAREAFGIFHDALGLALPIERFEAYSGTKFTVRLRDVAAAARAVKGDLGDLYLPMVATELGDLLAALGGEPAKHNSLRRLLAAHVDDGDSVLLVARTAGLGRAYREWIEDVGLDDVRVVPIDRLAEVQPADVAVLTGLAPRWARWVYRSGVGRRIEILAYATPNGEKSLTGFTEVAAAQGAIARQMAAATWLSDGPQRAIAVARLAGAIIPLPSRPTTTVIVASTPVPDEPDEPPGLWTEAQWFSAPDPERGRFDTRDGAAAEAVRVELEGGRWALFRLDGTVARWRAHSNVVDEAHPVSRLQVGDQLVFVDGDGHKHLMEKVLEVAEAIPALAVAAAWVAHWREVLYAAWQSAGSYVELTRGLEAHGCTVQAQTVRLWVIGMTLGPDDPEDIRRLGELREDSALRDHHLDVDGALRVLRGAHVRLGQRVARLARRVGPGASNEPDPDAYLDERSGLTAADFAHAVEVLTVRGIAPAGVVPASVLGRLNESEDEL